MLIDITLKITREMLLDAKNSEKPELLGHLGTHFDVMDKVFPLQYMSRNGIIFDVSAVGDRDIDLSDIDISKVKRDMFVAFYTGFADTEPYGSERYFKSHPQLSIELIDALVQKGVSIIALDFAGVRRGKEHTPKDQYCANNGVFIIENLCNLKSLLESDDDFVVHTYPMNFEGTTGLPCRVVAQLK